MASNGTKRLLGTIRDVKFERGFAWVDGDNGKRYFLHVHNLKGEVWTKEFIVYGTRVEFTPDETNRGPRAINAQLIS